MFIFCSFNRMMVSEGAHFKDLQRYVCVCVCSNSRNEVPRVAQRYKNIAPHTRSRGSILVVFIVFCMHLYSFASLTRRTPPPTFSDTAITDRHSDTTIFQLRAHWVRKSWSVGSEKSFGHVPQWDSNPQLPACKVSILPTRPGSPLIARKDDYINTNLKLKLLTEVIWIIPISFGFSF